MQRTQISLLLVLACTHVGSQVTITIIQISVIEVNYGMCVTVPQLELMESKAGIEMVSCVEGAVKVLVYLYTLMTGVASSVHTISIRL